MPSHNEVINENIMNNDNDKVDNRIARAAENMEDIPSLTESSDDSSSLNSDSTYLPKGDEDLLDVPKVIREVSEFNMANAQEIDSSEEEKSVDSSSLDTYITESQVVDLTQILDKISDLEQSDNNPSIQLMSVWSAY